MLELTVLGSGTYIPEKDRGCSGYLLRTDNKNIVFDFGRGTINKLLEIGINLYSLNNIFISHTHSDHLQELYSLIALILDPDDKSKLQSPYNIYGPVGLVKSIDSLIQAYGNSGHDNLNRINVEELRDGSIKNVGDSQIKAFNVFHNSKINCLAYRLHHNIKIFAYSGDSEVCDGLKKACQNTDLAVMEAILPLKKRKAGHLSGTEVGQIAQEHGIKKVIATHVDKSYLPKVKFDIEENYSGEVIVASDMLTVQI